MNTKCFMHVAYDIYLYVDVQCSTLACAAWAITLDIL